MFKLQVLTSNYAGLLSFLEIKKMSKEEAGIPKATVTKVIKESIPSDIRISKETTDILVEGCVEFVNMMAAEANNLCSKQNKKTIAPEHIIQALEVCAIFFVNHQTYQTVI